MDVPTVIVGTTQSGKTYRAFRLFEAHPGPAVFWDVQWRASDYSPSSVRVPTVESCVGVLAQWNPRMEPPRIIIQDEQYNGLETLVSYLWSVHRNLHARAVRPPSIAVFLDEVSLAADRYAGNDNPACRLFTQCYQHGVVGVAISQRPAQTSRNLLANAWEWYTFSPGRGDLDTYREYSVLPPDPSWLSNPRAHQYYRWTSDGRCLRGDSAGGEIDVVATQVPEVQEGEPPSPLPEGEPDEPKGAPVEVVGEPAGGQVPPMRANRPDEGP